jgi:DNA-binding NarL/FixJ family response regulator
MKPSSVMAPLLVVVDPDPTFAHTAECWLREGFPGHHVGSMTHLPPGSKSPPHLALIEATQLDRDRSRTLASVKRRWPHTCIVLYDDAPLEDFLQQPIFADLAGWLAKPLARNTLVTAVAAVLAGCTVLKARSRNLVSCEARGSLPNFHMLTPRCGLSHRQAQILDLLARGHTEKEVANLLQMSPRTVNHHIERLYRKWGVRNRAEALRRWLVSTPPPPLG